MSTVSFELRKKFSSDWQSKKVETTSVIFQFVTKYTINIIMVAIFFILTKDFFG